MEDSSRLRPTLNAGLRRAGHAADAGNEGLWMAENHDYDVMVLDLMLPRLNGLDLLRKLRGGGRQTHVLILTAKGSVQDRVAGLRAGADDYLVKPFAFAELLARVEALARRRHLGKERLLRLADLELDREARTVRKAGSSVALTPREYRLLELLALRARQVVSRSEIENQPCDESTKIFSNVVDSTVSTLRKKLHASGSDPLIRTRHGLGYILDNNP